MPEIKLIAVKGFTTQDEKYPASNLLSGKGKNGKWLVSAKTTTSMTATFQLEECCIISSVDIGNSGSAFIEILVSRTGCDEYKVLLPTSSLMTVAESKTGQNKTGVRMFSKDDFLKETRDQEWDVLRVIVTQKFNLQITFGLSFIHVFSFKEEASENTGTMGDFLLRVEKMKNSTPKPSTPRSRFSGQISKNSSPLTTQTHEKERLPNMEVEKEDEAMFEASVLSFMDSLELQNKDLDSIKLADVREKMEAVQNRIFTLHERRVFTNIVKKYVKSFQSSNAKNISRPVSSSPNDIAHCSKDENPGVKATAFTVKSPSHSQNMKKNGSWIDTSEWLSAEASTSKVNSPSVRRNNISMEDCSDNHHNSSHDKDDDDCVKTSNCSKQQTMDSFVSKRTFKRKHSIEDTTRKKLCVSDVIDISDEVPEKHEINSDSNNSVTKMVECPICKVLFEADDIEEHSSGCTEFADSNDSLIEDVTCPMCSKKINAFTADLHANKCASEMFGD